MMHLMFPQEFEFPREVIAIFLIVLSEPQLYLLDTTLKYVVLKCGALYFFLVTKVVFNCVLSK